MIDKIRPVHLQRLAVVYVRQSTLRQVQEHPESTRRQYGLRERASKLGWSDAAIDVIDEDLGQSGADTTQRHGFRRLSEQVAQGRVGAIFALEVSRLSRSSADWYRLLDLCGITDVVLVDEHAVYDPTDPNDRLILGIKGTMSEAERVWIQLRLRGARVSKARRGELRMPTSIGYLWDGAASRLRLDPDEEVRGALRAIFERFRVERSARGVMRYFVQHGLRVPSRRGGGEGELRWSAPRPSRILDILHNPAYAGAYVYGRTALRVTLVKGTVVRRVASLPPEEWSVVHRDHHPAYISWEEFVDNLRILKDNDTVPSRPERHGVAQQGEALLQGLVLCGRCGHRMYVAYSGRWRRARYVCISATHQGRSPHMCWSVAAAAIDQALAEAFLDALEPDAVALGLAVMKEVERQTAGLDRQWRQRVERASYEARLAERRYKAVDPDNRTVARTLEHEWDTKLRELERAEREHREQQARDKLVLTDDDRARITQLSRDVPRLWAAPTTTMAQRKMMLRTLVSEVCLAPLGVPEGGTRVRVMWSSGALSDLAVARQRPGRRTSAAAVALMRDLVAQMTPAAEIAVALNRAGLLRATGRPWSKADVHAHCRLHGIRWPRPMPTSIPQPERRADGAYSARGVARRLRVTRFAVLYWVQQGWLVGEAGGGRGRPWWFRLDAAAIARLRRVRAAHTGPRSRTGYSSKRATPRGAPPI
jgi:DNA invertase Pin-like site-specific DNA recombinase